MSVECRKKDRVLPGTKRSRRVRSQQRAWMERRRAMQRRNDDADEDDDDVILGILVGI